VPGKISNESESADVKPGAVAINEYISAAFVICKSVYVATPPDTVTVAVPLISPFPGLLNISRVTCVELSVVTKLLFASRISTTGWRSKVLPCFDAEGITVKTNCTALPWANAPVPDDVPLPVPV